MKAIIVEDQPAIREEIQGLVRAHCPDVEIHGSADSVVTAAKLVRDVQPELIFLDIELPDGTGFDLLDIIDVPVKVIFITGSDSYATRAFRYAAIDYLLKPVDSVELVEAVKRAQTGPSLEQDRLQLSRNIIAGAQQLPDRLALHTAEKIHFIEIKNILRCMADGNYTKFFLRDNTSLLVARTLKDYDNLLSDADFIRVHQSHLVNMKAAKEYVKVDGGYLVMSDGAKIPVSTRKKAVVMERFGRIPR